MIDVVLPVLNEAEALPWVLDRIPPGFRPLVVDNGSSDDSASVARARGAAVFSEPDPGFGAACWAGLRRAESDKVAFMDCDGSLDPGDLTLLAEAMARQDAGLVLGRRMAEKSAWPLHARVANRLLTREVKRRTSVELSDLGPMRMADRRRLLELELRDRRFGWPLEMVLRAAQAGWLVIEVPVPYRNRRGESKVTGTFRGTWRATRDMGGILLR